MRTLFLSLLVGLSLLLGRRSSTAGDTAGQIQFDFRGQRTGEPLSEETLTQRGYGCGPSSDFDRFCNAPLSLDKGEYIGGVLVHLHYYLLDGKFARLYIGFGYAANQKMLDAFSTKFGPPHKTEQETIQNRLGAVFTRNKHT